METTKVKDRRRGATLILPALLGWALEGVAPDNDGSYTIKGAMGDLTRDHYLSSPPIEPSLKEFLHIPEKF